MTGVFDKKLKWIKVIFHVHTIASYDSVMTIGRIMRYCRKNSIDILIIADHNSIEISRKANSTAGNSDVIVIPAVEYNTNAGDIVGMFSEKISESKECKDVLQTIKHRDGLSVLVHPMKGHNLEMIPMDMIDIIETRNSRCTERQNEVACQLSRLHNKAEFVGSDAHFPWELGLAVNYLSLDKNQENYLKDASFIKEMFMSASRRFYFKQTTRLSIYLSQLIKGLRKKDVNIIHSNFKNIMVEIGRRSLVI